VHVDVDWMSPEYIRGMEPFKFHDQTSNQIWVNTEIHADYNQELLKQTAKELQGKGWLAVYTRMVLHDPFSGKSSTHCPRVV
jgi:transaldolase